MLPDDVLKSIRSVALSKVGGVPVQEFLRDYKDLEGKPLLYRSLGYNSLEELLNDIPTTVKVNEKGRVFGVVEPGNMHMNHTAKKAQWKGPQESQVFQWEKELKANLKGLFCLCMPRKGSYTIPMIDEAFSKYGELAEVAMTERYVFVRFPDKNSALNALENEKDNFDLRIPEEKNNPKRVVKSTDTFINPQGAPDQIEVFIGNLPKTVWDNDIENLLGDLRYKGFRLCKKKDEDKKFCFVLVDSMAECSEICEALKQKKVHGQTIVVQPAFKNVPDYNNDAVSDAKDLASKFAFDKTKEGDQQSARNQFSPTKSPVKSTNFADDEAPTFESHNGVRGFSNDGSCSLRKPGEDSYNLNRGASGDSYNLNRGASGDSYNPNRGASGDSYNPNRGASGDSYNPNRGASGDSYNPNRGASGDSYNPSRGASRDSYNPNRDTSSDSYNVNRVASRDANNSPRRSPQKGADGTGNAGPKKEEKGVDLDDLFKKMNVTAMSTGAQSQKEHAKLDEGRLNYQCNYPYHADSDVELLVTNFQIGTMHYNLKTLFDPYDCKWVHIANNKHPTTMAFIYISSMDSACKLLADLNGFTYFGRQLCIVRSYATTARFSEADSFSDLKITLQGNNQRTVKVNSKIPALMEQKIEIKKTEVEVKQPFAHGELRGRGGNNRGFSGRRSNDYQEPRPEPKEVEGNNGFPSTSGGEGGNLNSRVSRGSLECSQGSFDSRVNSSRGRLASDSSQGRRSFDDSNQGQGYDSSRGSSDSNRGRGSFDSNRGRGSFDSNRVRGSFDSNRGGRGSFDSNRGGRGSFDSSRGGRGSYNSDRGRSIDSYGGAGDASIARASQESDNGQVERPTKPRAAETNMQDTFEEIPVHDPSRDARTVPENVRVEPNPPALDRIKSVTAVSVAMMLPPKFPSNGLPSGDVPVVDKPSARKVVEDMPTLEMVDEGEWTSKPPQAKPRNVEQSPTAARANSLPLPPEIPGSMSLQRMQCMHKEVFDSIYRGPANLGGCTVLVAAVEKGSYFWAQNLDEEFKDLTKLLDELDGLDQSGLLKAFARGDKRGVAKFMDVWNRAWVEEVMPGGDLKIFFFDWGNTEILKPDCFRVVPSPADAMIFRSPPGVVPCHVQDTALPADLAQVQYVGQQLSVPGHIVHYQTIQLM